MRAALYWLLLIAGLGMSVPVLGAEIYTISSARSINSSYPYNQNPTWPR